MSGWNRYVIKTVNQIKIFLPRVELVMIWRGLKWRFGFWIQFFHPLKSGLRIPARHILNYRSEEDLKHFGPTVRD